MDCQETRRAVASYLFEPRYCAELSKTFCKGGTEFLGTTTPAERPDEKETMDYHALNAMLKPFTIAAVVGPVSDKDRQKVQ